MIRATFSALRPARYRSRKPSKSRTRLLRSELLEPRTLLSGTGFQPPPGLPPLGAAPAAQTTANASPKVAQPITADGNATVTGKTASLSVLGSDDGVKVWVNNTPVFENNVVRAFVAGQDKFEASLKKGSNDIVIKVSQLSGGWTVSLQIITLDGKLITLQ